MDTATRASRESDDVELVVVVDRATLTCSEAGSITGGIWFEAAGRSFPETGWDDFVVVILGGWLGELRALPARNNPRATIRLLFMDGPLEVEVSSPQAMSGRWRARFVHRSDRRRGGQEMEISGQAIIRSMCEAAQAVLEVCDARGWATGEVEGLRASLGVARHHWGPLAS